MNNTLSKVLIFVAGAAIGSVVTWKIAEKKYEQIIKEDVESVKRELGIISAKKEKVTEDDPDEDDEPEYISDDDAIEQARDILRKNGYTNYSGTPEPSERKYKKMEDVEKPYVIPPDEYGELYDYDTIELSYYADGILADSMGEPVDDIEEFVGHAALSSFGEYEDDAVHIRNDKLKIDYEIIRVLDKHSDIYGNGPRRVEEE